MGAEGQVDVNQLATTDLDAYMSPLHSERDRPRPAGHRASAPDGVKHARRAGAGCRRIWRIASGCAGGRNRRRGSTRRRAPCPPSSASRRLHRRCNRASLTLATCNRLAKPPQLEPKRLTQPISKASFKLPASSRRRQTRWAASTGQRFQSELTGLDAQMSAGERQRALEQAQLQSDYAMFQEQQGYPLTQLNALLAAGSGVPAGLGTVTTRDPFGGLTAVGKRLGGGDGAGRFQADGFEIRLDDRHGNDYY